MMDKRRVVITGIGILSACGTGKDAFFDAVLSGKSGIKPITLFDTKDFTVKTAGEISDFNPQEFLGVKGLRTLDRSIKLVSCAAYLGLKDSGLEITEENSRSTGIAIGSTLGSAHSIMEFDKEALREGPHYVNPALFPNTVVNSPASQLSIRFNIKGFNATLSTGFSASLDALKYAFDFLRLGRIKAVLTGGVEELCLETFLGFYKTGLMENNGFILGEGSAVLVLEDLESALARKRKIYAEVLAFGNGIGPSGLQDSVNSCLNRAGLSDKDIDLVQDMEKIRSLTGDCLSAQGAVSAAAGLASMEKNANIDKVLISASGLNCTATSMIIGRFQ